MNDKNLTTGVSPIRAKSFNVKTTSRDFAQYVNTIKAYASAGMPFEHIANAGDELGDSVERMDLDANILEAAKSKAGEIAEDEGKILAWQNRGEMISVTRQLPTGGTSSGLVNTSNALVTEQTPEQKINVLEGIAVTQNPQNLVSSTASDSQLESNPYLKAPPKDF